MVKYRTPFAYTALKKKKKRHIGLPMNVAIKIIP